MKTIQKIGAILIILTTLAIANDELAKDIKYIGNNGIETKNQIICTNGNEAFVYIHNITKEIKVEIDGSIENSSKITLDEIVKKVCH